MFYNILWIIAGQSTIVISVTEQSPIATSSTVSEIADLQKRRVIDLVLNYAPTHNEKLESVSLWEK